MWDLDLSPHCSQPLTSELTDVADLIFAMAPEHHREVIRIGFKAADKTYLLKRFPDSTGDGEKVVDPIGMDLEYYNEVFLEIGEYLGKHLPEILKHIDGKVRVE